MISGLKSKFKEVETIIFDADGVITTENEYWLAAELAILELFYSGQWIGLHDDSYLIALHKPGRPVIVGRFVHGDFTERLKARGVVSNWDMAYFCCALFLIELLGAADTSSLADALAGEGFTPENIRALGGAVANKSLNLPKVEDLGREFLDAARLPSGNGGVAALTAALNERAKAKCGLAAPVFRAGDPLWSVCRALFQEWYLGDDLFGADGSEKLSEIAKDGLIQYETPIVPVGRLMDVFSMCREANLTLGIGTGRPYAEIVTPLANWGLLNFFSLPRISTNREIAEAERRFADEGRKVQLSKPHPYVYLKALFPEKSPAEILEMPLPIPGGERALVVGDTAADIAAAKAIGAQSAAVASSVKNFERAESIKAMAPDYILSDVTALRELF